MQSISEVRTAMCIAIRRICSIDRTRISHGHGPSIGAEPRAQGRARREGHHPQIHSSTPRRMCSVDVFDLAPVAACASVRSGSHNFIDLHATRHAGSGMPRLGPDVRSRSCRVGVPRQCHARLVESVRLCRRATPTDLGAGLHPPQTSRAISSSHPSFCSRPYPRRSWWSHRPAWAPHLPPRASSASLCGRSRSGSSRKQHQRWLSPWPTSR